MTTFAAVIKAFFDIVVYTSPIVCIENPIKENTPSKAPLLRDSLLMFFFISLKNIVPKIKLATKNLTVKVCIALTPPSSANFVPIKPLPHMIAMVNNPISPMCFFISSPLTILW